MIYPLAWFGPENMIIIAVIGLLLFGRRLPEVGRSLGKGIVEFKKGLQGIEEDIDDAVKRKPQSPEPVVVNRQLADTSAAATSAGYKFDPFTGKPIQVDPVTGKQMRFDPYTGKPLIEDSAEHSASETPGI